MADTDLYPTPYRLGLLRDVADGRVCDDPDCVPMLDLGDGESVRVANAVWEMRRAGWVELPHGPDRHAAPRRVDVELIKVLASGIYLMWTLSLSVALMGSLVSMLRPGSRRLDVVWRAFAHMHQELWIAVPPCIAFAAVDHWHAHPWYGLFCDALSLVIWVQFRDWPDDENRWKRRGRKLLDAVAERAGRLVVVPS